MLRWPFRMVAATCLAAIGICIGDAAEARTFDVEVGGRTAPWISAQNGRFAFGVGDARPPQMIWNAPLRKGLKVRFTAKGGVSWIAGGAPVGPRGDPGRMIDRSITYLPASYVGGKIAVGMGGLIGAFVNADGRIVGRPFVIGDRAEVVIPDGAAAISIGINDDFYSDNSGSFSVRVEVAEPSVTVEQ